MSVERFAPKGAVPLLAALCAAGFFLTPLRGPDVEFAFALWAFLAMLPAGVFAGWCLLDAGSERTRVQVAWTAIAALWVAIASGASVVPHLSLGQALLIWTAGGVYLVANLLARVGYGGWVLAICAISPVIYAVHAGIQIDIDGAPAWRFRDRNALADAVVLGVCAALAIVVHAGRNALLQGAIALTIAAGAWAVLELLTARIGLLLLAAVVLLAAAIASARRVHRRMAVVWIGAVMMGSVVAATLDVGEGPAALPSGELRSQESLSRGVVAGTLALRGELIAGAGRLVPAHPLFGSGLQSFLSRYEGMQSPAVFHSAAMVHNDYLQVAVELGLPAAIGLLALVCFVFLRWFIAVRRALCDTFDARTLAGAILLLGPLALFAHAWVNFPLYDGQLLFTGAAVLAVGLCWADWEAPERSAAIAPFAGGLAAAALMAVVLNIHAAGLLARSSVVLEGEPLAPGVMGARPTMEAAFDVAQALREHGMPGGRAAFEAGRILMRRWEAEPTAADALAVAGLAALGEAVERDPYEPEYAVQLARALWLTGAPIASRRGVLERAIALRPKDARTYLSLAAHEMRAGELSAARRVAAERWLPWCRHGAFRRPETSDLLALARAGQANPALWDRCAELLARDGIFPSDPDDVRARLAPAQSG